MRAPNLSFACTYVRVFLTRAPCGSWNEWVKARDNKGPLLTNLAKTHPGLRQALAKEDAIEAAVADALEANEPEPAPEDVPVPDEEPMQAAMAERQAAMEALRAQADAHALAAARERTALVQRELTPTLTLTLSLSLTLNLTLTRP